MGRGDENEVYVSQCLCSVPLQVAWLNMYRKGNQLTKMHAEATDTHGILRQYVSMIRKSNIFEVSGRVLQPEILYSAHSMSGDVERSEETRSEQKDLWVMEARSFKGPSTSNRLLSESCFSLTCHS